MEKDVMVTIGGMLSAGDGEDNIDMVLPGQYYWRNERHFLIYEEVMDDFAEPTSNLIRFSPEEVSVRKNGVIQTSMVFRTDEDTVTEYTTPYGTIVLTIHTERIRIQETEERITLWIDYILSADSDNVARNYLRIMVQPRTKEFSLR